MASSIQLLRSTNAQERPFPGNLLEGQPAVNLNASEPGLFFKAADGTLVKFGPAAITSDGSPPNSSPQGSAGNTIGELWLDKSVDPAVLKVYDGTAWVDAGSGGGGGGTASFVRWIYTAAGGETSLSGSSGGVLLEYTPGLEEVYVNGVLITRGTDYSATNGTSITNLSALTAGDVITVMSINPVETIQLPGQVTLLRWTVLATSGQTVFSGVDSSGQQLNYSPGFEEVYVNGAFLRREIDYTATDGTTITGLSPLAEDDEITVMAWTPFTVGDQIVDADVATNASISSTKLEFLQSGTDAVPRTVQSKFGESISVKDFGALGNGTGDDTTEIQAAIDSLGASGGIVYFPKGEYHISSALQIGSGVKLIGEGRASTTIRVINTTANAIEIAPGSRFIVISGLTIRASGFGSDNSAIRLDDNNAGAENRFEDLTVIVFKYAIKAGTSFWNNNIRNCKFFTQVGVRIYDNSGLSIQNLFEDVYFNQDTIVNSLAVEFRLVFTTTFLNCNFGGDDTAGQFVKATGNCYGISFINCNFELQMVPAGQAAFDFTGRMNVLFDACTFWFIRQLNPADDSSIIKANGSEAYVTVKTCDINPAGPNSPISYYLSAQNGGSISVEQSPEFEDSSKHQYVSGTNGYGKFISVSSTPTPSFSGLRYGKGGAIKRPIVSEELSTSYTFTSSPEDFLRIVRTAAPASASQNALVGGKIHLSFAGTAAGQPVSAYSEFSFKLDNGSNEQIIKDSQYSPGSVTINTTVTRSGNNYRLALTPSSGAIISGTISIRVTYTKAVNDLTYDFDVSLLK